MKELSEAIVALYSVMHFWNEIEFRNFLMHVKNFSRKISSCRLITTLKNLNQILKMIYISLGSPCWENHVYLIPES